MKQIILLVTLVMGLTACNAQIYPLNTFFEDVPNYSYMKDLDNLLSPYVGTYKATYDGNETTLYITKEDKMLTDYGPNDKKYYEDVLHIKYTVKKISSGVILQDTRNPIDPKRNKIISIGTNTLDNNSVELIHFGGACEIGGGNIKLRKPSANQISWSYYPDSLLLNVADCPLSIDRKIYLPDVENLIFIKQ